MKLLKTEMCECNSVFIRRLNLLSALNHLWGWHLKDQSFNDVEATLCVIGKFQRGESEATED